MRVRFTCMTFSDSQKIAARQMLATAVRRGDVVRLPCQKCGKKRSEAHHHDYSKPFDVKWFCHKHHIEEHMRVYGFWGKKRKDASVSDKGELRVVTSIRAFPSLMDRSRRAARKSNKKHADWMHEAIAEKLERKQA